MISYNFTSRSLFWSAAIALGASACSDEDDARVLEPENPMMTGNGGSGGSQNLQDPEPPPLWVVSTRVSVGDEAVGYLVPVSELSDTFDLDRAVETTVGTIYAAPGTSSVYHASADEPTITRWDLSEDGDFSKGPVLSFSNLGFGTVDGALGQPFYAEDKAYFVAFGEAPEVVIWNPRDMELIGTIPIDLEPRGALLPTLTSFQRNDRLFVTAFWEEDFDTGDWSVFGDRANLIEIDPATDSIVNMLEEGRCNVLDAVSTTPDGTAYFSPRGFWIPVRAMLGDERGAAPCAVRVVPPGASFEDGYSLDLSALVGGRQAGDLNFVNANTALIDAWHPDLVTPLAADNSNWSDVAFENGHMWWRWTLGESQAQLVPDQEPGAYGGVIYNTGREKLVLRAEGDFSESTLFELTAAGEMRPLLSGPGYVWGIVQVR